MSLRSIDPPRTAPGSPLIAHVFVYGTLRRGQCREGCWPRPPLHVATGFVQAELFDLGPYPAILVGKDWVCGECWTLREEDVEETLRVLDAIEGFAQPGEDDLYVRRVVDILTAPPPATAPDARSQDAPVHASSVRGYAYFLVAERLPSFARRIAARAHPELAGLNAPAGGAGRVYACWPDDGRTVAETSSLPDPFDAPPAADPAP
ncbi:gamma-glutamylcyclotransferase family protein [Candidatus Laterigemmans baculatus]|uniref:gamma-glutamylcyclotransferase family protein n=1 Tax=Candidatus Laterigemmans baculatus TaxID=2770505 RepID=UPI0013DA8A7A|nr:gamma-glutamylcyclotransferase family protein [Candidatus Laterigemmans baculatus]